MTRPPRARLGGAVAFGRRFSPLALVLLSAALLASPIGSLGGTGPVPTAAPARTSNGPMAPASLPSLAASAGGGPSGLGLPCPTVLSDWASLYGSAPPPPGVLGTSASSCVPGADTEGVGFTPPDWATGAGSFRMAISVPSNSLSDARGFGAFSVTVAVSGVPCSFDNLSYLQVVLVPPGSPWSSASGDVWQVQAPVFDLVPPGSCDPRCQNSSAIFPIDGERFCEDNAIARGIGSPGWGSDPAVSPGDLLTLSVRPGNSTGLSVYLNDTTNSADSAHWSYPSNATVSGTPLHTLFERVPANGSGWAPGGPLGASWTNCPMPSGAIGLPGCDSYDATLQAALAFPSVGNVTFSAPPGVATLGGSPYSSISTWSTTGACFGDPIVPACHGFGAGLGSASYPPIDLFGGSGVGRIGYGSNGTGVALQFANASAGFSEDGAPTQTSPGGVSSLVALATNRSITMSARVTDPRGIDQVVFAGVWCFAGGSSTSPTVVELNGTASSGGSNGPSDSTYSATFPRGSNTTGGTLYYWAREYGGVPNGSGSLPVDRSEKLAGGSLTCGSMSYGSPPTPFSVRRLAEGYNVTWLFPFLSLSGELRNWSVGAVPTSGPAVMESIPDPSARSAVLSGLTQANIYTVYVGVTYVDGMTQRLTSGVGQTAPTPYGPLVATTSLSATTLFQPSYNLTITADVSGGLAPYSVDFLFGDGGNATVHGVTSNATASAVYPGYLGTLDVRVEVEDAAGDVALSNSTLVDVRATPWGTNVTLIAGDNTALLSWLPPDTPIGEVVRYTVYYTQASAGAAILTEGWPSVLADAAGTVFLINTTSNNLTLASTNGVPLTVAVIGWNEWGAGLEPANGPSIGESEPFKLESFTAAPYAPLGGPAPFSVALTARASAGSGDPVTTATFSQFNLGLNVPASVASVSNASATASWANGTITINSTGTYRVEVHLSDAALDSSLVGLLVVYVGPGAAPTVAISIGTGLAFADHPVFLNATASGTPGPFGYAWQFGDGASAQGGRSMEHTYTASGSFTITVTVTDRSTEGVTTVTKGIDVFEPPRVAIVASAGSAGVASFNFESLESGGSAPASSVVWSFGDGTSVDGPNATHTYASGGRYLVRVALTDPSGLTANASLVLNVPNPSGGSSSGSAFGSFGVPVALLLAVLVIVLLVLLVREKGRRPPMRSPSDRDVYASKLSLDGPSATPSGPPEASRPEPPSTR